MATGTLKNKLADKLRLEDPEQFLTLVRMHLSFVLDLNTDDYECAEKNKFRPSKWVFGKKTKCLTKGVMEGAPLTQEGICQAYQLIEYLTKESSICQEGLFRRTGKLTRQQELKALLNKGVSLDLDNGNFSVHDCASVLKSFLAELPEPLLTDAHYPIYCQIAEFCGPASNSGQSESNELRLLHSLQLLLLLLPAENRILLQDVLKLLNLTASYESCNKMSAENLSTLFTPHLLCPRKLTPEAFHANSQAMSGIVAFMIHKGDLLFEIPPKLSTDIQVYWAERERRKVSGRRKLGSNICEGPPANTVFTFVDRERSAQENSSNPTEVALAQLYAHIQSLPESSKKRKLIKQFNKENGQGTPLQESYRQKHHHRSKSLGDSIKRHIFNKGVKRHKSSNHSNVFGPLRSVSQEVLNSPLTPSSKIKHFHCSMDEESDVTKALDSITNLPVLQQSLCDSNSAVLRLRHSSRTSRTSFTNRLIFPENDDRNETINTSLRDAILHNLAHQVAQQHSPNSDSGVLRKPLIHCCQEKGNSSPLHSTSSAGESSTCVSNSIVKGACKARNEDTNDAPVSSDSALCVTPDEQSAVSPQLLLGFTPCVATATNKLTTPQKEQINSLVTSTPASQYFTRVSGSVIGPYDIKQTSLNHSNCFLTPIADENNSMSPITRSTQRMSKAMQETMMTPRSRKPVVVLSGSNICHLSNVSTWQKHAANLWENHYKEKGILDKVRENPLDEKAVRSINVLSTKSISSHDTSSSHSSIVNEDVCQNISHANCCGSGDSLTSTFKSYLMSRSVLTASPVDLSFSSRTGDFDTSLSHERCLSTDALSDSLLYCLDGNEPSCSSQSLSSGEKFKESPELQENLCTQDCSSIIDCNNEPNINNAKRFLAVDSIPSNEVGMKSHLAPVHETSL
ncbi:hypothetical protein R5R35_007978 [Gryllus longicercus]|uniref:Rho-GAP domain-containing protein n=1 Tax=Gryllus longicercus TaxID=2509291 RepID=A0AAN9Z0S1_9ORTH